MPRQVLTQKEIDKFEKELRQYEIEPLTFYQSRANDGDLVTAGGLMGTFIADKDYVIKSVTISAAADQVTTPLPGLCLLTRRSTHVHTVAVNQGEEIAAMAFKSEAGMVFPFNAGNVYLDKGKSLFGHLHNSSADGNSTAKITVYLIPTYKQ